MTALVAASTQDFPIHISEDATITKVRVLTRGGPGSCVIDIWKDTYASYPPTVADSICASAKPTIVAGHKYEDETLTGWTTLVSRGDTLLVHIESTSTFEAIGVFLEIEPVGSVDTDGYTDERVREIIAEEGLPGSVVNEGDNFIITLGSGLHEDIDVFALCGEPTDPGEITFTIPDGVVVRATSRTRAAINFAGFASGSTINFINLGHALGCGGDGGDGGAIVQVFDSPDIVTRYEARDGQTGGPAVKGPGTGRTFLVTNAGGFLWAGGNGGGGGGASQSNGSNRVALGGGGGGGAGGGKRGQGFTAGGASVLAEAASGADGSGGVTGEGGIGGAGTQAGSSTDGGDGGDGGDYGEAGEAGESPTGFTRDLAGGAAGTTPIAVDLNGGTVTFISGGTAPNVKGSVT